MITFNSIIKSPVNASASLALRNLSRCVADLKNLLFLVVLNPTIENTTVSTAEGGTYLRSDVFQDCNNPFYYVRVM